MIWFYSGLLFAHDFVLYISTCQRKKRKINQSLSVEYDAYVYTNSEYVNLFNSEVLYLQLDWFSSRFVRRFLGLCYSPEGSQFIYFGRAKNNPRIYFSFRGDSAKDTGAFMQTER